MMNVLLLFPDPLYYENKPFEFYSNLRLSVSKLHNAAKLHKWNLHCLFSDEVAIIERPEGARWVSTLDKGDLYFMQTHNEVMSRIPLLEGDVSYYENYYREAAEKYPIVGKLDENARFLLACKRETYVRKRVFKEFNSFILFGSKSHKTYPISPKEGDGRMIMYIDLVFFKAETYLNGNKVVNTDILNFGTANNAVYSWEV